MTNPALHAVDLFRQLVIVELLDGLECFWIRGLRMYGYEFSAVQRFFSSCSSSAWYLTCHADSLMSKGSAGTPQFKFQTSCGRSDKLRPVAK